MKTVIIKIKKLVSNAHLPAYAHLGEYGDLGADLCAIEDVELLPGEVKSIRTGIAVEFPPGFGAIVSDRSSLALRGFTTLAGIIDPGYHGEIKVVATNLGSRPLRVTAADRIAQLIILEKTEAKFIEAENMQPSDRAEGGFGSTGQ